MDDQRNAVITVAREWLKTPYHHHGRIKGVGVDCLTLLAEVYHEAGIVPQVQLPAYSPQWHLHRSTELYLEGLLQYAHEIESPQPGDIALWKFGRCFSHGAIVVKWPQVIHAYIGKSVVLEDADKAQWLKFIGEKGKDHGKPRPVKFFTPWR